MVGRSSALSYNNASVEMVVPNNSKTDKRCRCNQQTRFGKPSLIVAALCRYRRNEGGGAMPADNKPLEEITTP